jgi:hypothetical protein
MYLSDEDIGKLLAACSDSRNRAALNLLTYAGAYTVSGVLTKLMHAHGAERQLLMDLIGATLAEHDRLSGEN